MPFFIRRPSQAQIIEAEMLTAGAQAHPQGSRSARPGEWIVTDHAAQRQFVMTDAEFQAQYEPLAVPQGAFQPTQPQPEPGQPERSPEEIDTTPPVEPQTGDASLDQPLVEQLPGRPSIGPETRPRLESTEPVTTPTGLPNQPGTADDAFRQSNPPQDQTGNVFSSGVAAPPPLTYDAGLTYAPEDAGPPSAP